MRGAGRGSKLYIWKQVARSHADRFSAALSVEPQEGFALRQELDVTSCGGDRAVMRYNSLAGSRIFKAQLWFLVQPTVNGAGIIYVALGRRATP